MSVSLAPARKPTFWLTLRDPCLSETLVGKEKLAIGRRTTVWAWSGAAAQRIAVAPPRRSDRTRTLVCGVARMAIPSPVLGMSVLLTRQHGAVSGTPAGGANRHFVSYAA